MIDVLKRFPRNRRPISSILTLGMRVPNRYRRPDPKSSPIQVYIDIGHWGIPHCALCFNEVDRQPVINFTDGLHDWYCLGCAERIVRRENLRFWSAKVAQHRSRGADE